MRFRKLNLNVDEELSVNPENACARGLVMYSLALASTVSSNEAQYAVRSQLRASASSVANSALAISLVSISTSPF